MSTVVRRLPLRPKQRQAYFTLATRESTMSDPEKPSGGGDSERPKPDRDLRAVPGAGAYSSGGKVIYNMLDPMMQQLMGRSIGAVKKAGMRARGTGQFSISLDDGTHELLLDEFYARLCDDPSAESAIMEDLVTAAKKMCGQS
jgi:hypothetical protein